MQQRSEWDCADPLLQIRINMEYLSLNARDLQIVTNDYPAPHSVPQDVVPVSGTCTPNPPPAAANLVLAGE